MSTQIRRPLIDTMARMQDPPMRLLVVVVAGILGGACTRPVANVCCTTFEDCSAIGLDQVRGCDEGLVCVQHMCTAQTTECILDNDCGAAKPHCSAEGVCVECIDSTQCQSAAPFCSAANACVVCLDSTQCPSAAPVCAANACRGCVVGSECQGDVCETSDGTCPTETDIAFASPTGLDAAPCTKTDQCSIKHAFDVVTPTRKYVKLATGSYSASIVIANKKVVLDGFGASVTPGTGTGFDVEAQGSLTLRGVSVISTTSRAPVVCGTPTSALSLDQVLLDSSQQAAIGALGCALDISRSKIHVRDKDVPPLLATDAAKVNVDRSTFDGGGGLIAAGTNTVLHMTNSIVSNQATAFSTRAFTGPETGSIFVSFSTVVNSPITCPMVGNCLTSGLCLSDMIAVNLGAGAPIDSVIPGNGCRVNFSALFPQTNLVNGANNVFMNPLLVDPANGDFHLKAGSPALDAADPTAANATDFDGAARPQNGRSDMGAFERKP